MVRCKQGKVAFPIELVETEVEATDGHVKSSKLSPTFSWKDLVANLVSIVSFVADIGSDIVVANIHYNKGDYWYFGLTVAFIVIPAIVMTIFSAIWYIEDFKKRAVKVSPIRWFITIVLLILQMGPILRYMDSMMYGLKSWKKKPGFYYQKMLYEDCDAAFLRLFEAFMEAAPQLVLQIYVVTKNSPHSAEDLWTVIFQGFTIFTSLMSLSWALAYYHRSLRFSVPEKDNISWAGTIAQILWYSFVIASRVLSLGLLAFISPIGLALFSAIHWAVMFVWIITMKTEFCETRFLEIMYNAVLGIVFIFSFLNPVDKTTRYNYIFYYALTFIENTIIMSVWYYISIDSLLWFRLPAMLFHFLSFFFGIFIMILYYLLLHPSGNIKLFHTDHTSKNTIGKENKQEHIKI